MTARLDASREQSARARRCVLVAHDLRLDRNVVGRALVTLRPDYTVLEVAPEDVERAVSERQPAAVICTTMTEVIQRRVPNWVWIHPAQGRHSIVCLGGQCMRVERLTLDALLDVLDLAVSVHG